MLCSSSKAGEEALSKQAFIGLFYGGLHFERLIGIVQIKFSEACCMVSSLQLQKQHRCIVKYQDLLASDNLTTETALRSAAET